MDKESVKVCDVEIEKLADLASCWDEANEILGAYVTIMEKICNDAVKSGKIHDALNNLWYYALQYKEYGEGLGKEVKSISSGFVKKIDRIDLDLYNK